MLRVTIPGQGLWGLEVLVLDFNGTLALDGYLPEGVREDLYELSKRLEIHILTADTFGTVAAECQGLPVRLKILKSDNHQEEKGAYVASFSLPVVAVGNGVNDIKMLEKAFLSILVMGREGCSGRALQAADVVVGDIRDALGLLLNPLRLAATLRS